MIPTLSQVKAWNVEPLDLAATRWENLADLWNDSFRRFADRLQGVHWSGAAADAAHARAIQDQLRIGQLAQTLSITAATARSAAVEIANAKRATLAAIGEAHAEAFIVEVDLTLTDRLVSDSLAEHLDREQQRATLTNEIKQLATALVALDQQAAEQLRRAAEGLASFSFTSPHQPDTNPVQLIDFHSAPPPEKPSWTSPDPPPGGWSEDPITRAAQKIAYGHASTKHLANEWPPGTSRDDLAREVERMMRSSIKPESGMIVGRTVDGAPAIYDPKTNTLLIRDAAAGDAGTVFKPTRGPAYLADKVPIRVPSLSTSDLADGPYRSTVEPPRAPRVGLPPMVGVPPMVDAPRPGPGDVPVLDVDGPPDVGLPGAGR
ncbi:hypothetical protein [Mycolicibacterium obuense]|uniref:hypothetical protein n=1 Tax=Mycolicibacterium obuense TaxID=1807 RepID=UPI000B17FB8E|nr:hypothetical protein [Mycolicibacterium obuense]